MIDHSFLESANPRSKDSCVRCGRPKDIHENTSPKRDLEWESRFYRELEEKVTTRSGMTPTVAIELTRHRMEAIGATQYGDSSFLTDGRDLLKEFTEETSDALAYIVMEFQRGLLRGEDDPEIIFHLFEAAVHATIADGHVRAAKARQQRQRES